MVEGLYRLEIVGGPFDGVTGFKWRRDGAHPLPTSLKVGMCTGHGECASEECAVGQPHRHAAFWHPELEDPPVGAVTYVLEDDSVQPASGESEGMARYALGGLGGVLAGEAMEEAICYG